MNQDDTIRHQVAASLKEASNEQLVRIMQFIDRLPSRQRIDDVVAPVRGRLALVKPARSMTLSRVLVAPFEDLLVGPDLMGTSPWFIPRDMTGVATGIFFDALDPGRRAELDRRLTGKTMDDLDTLLETGEEIWPVAADAIIYRIERRETSSGIGPHLHLPLRGIAGILRCGTEVVTFLEQLPPRPMPRLRNDQRGAAMSLLYSMGQVSPEMFRYAFTILVRRSTEPMEFFELILNADFGIPPELRDMVLAETAHECLHEVDVMQQDMAEQTDRSAVDTANAALRIASLIESLENAPRQVQVNAKRLADTKAKASQSIIKSYQGALSGELRETFDTVAKPANSVSASDAEVEHAENVARSTRKIQLAGGRIGAGSNLEQVRNGHFEEFRRAILQKAGKMRVSGTARLAALMEEIRLVEIVFGSEAAQSLVAELRS